MSARHRRVPGRVSLAQISVLMSVYNVEAYVAEALASIQSQTYSDIEIVVVDDGSTDETPSIIDKIASADPRVKVVRSAKNLGLQRALNLGLQFCTSPYIARMDGDDIALPTRLEKQLQFLEENPTIALVGCASRAIDPEGRTYKNIGIKHYPISQSTIAKSMLLANPVGHFWVARREVYDALSGYRELRYAEDLDFLLRAVSAGYLLGNLPDALMLMRTRFGQESGCLGMKKGHRYVTGLYRERMKYGKDSFSVPSYQQATKVGRLENACYRLAQKYQEKKFRSQSRICRVLYMGLSAVVSPWQARYYIERARLKLIYRTERFS